MIGILLALLFGAALAAQTRFGVSERAPAPRPTVAPISSPVADFADRQRSGASRADRGGRIDLSRHDDRRRYDDRRRGRSAGPDPRDPRHDRGRGPRYQPVLHHGRSGYWRHVRERVWVPGRCRWVTYPARYEWRYDSCGRRYRVLCEPARRVRVQDPGYWDWQVRRVWVPGC